MDPRFYAFIGPALVIVLAVLGFMTRCISRSVGIPRCWRCGARKVRRSHGRSLIDLAAGLFLLRPFRCTGCRVRFYGLRLFEERAARKAPVTASLTPAPARSRAPHLRTQNPAWETCGFADTTGASPSSPRRTRSA